MTRWPQVLVALVAVTLPSLLHAGGSYESVLVTNLRIVDDTDFELVVTPIARPPADGYKDPYMGTCPTFTVHGTYSRVRSALLFPADVTRDTHLAALSHLKQAHAARRPVNLGWMGTGFVRVDSAAPCIVRSRALQLLIERGETSIVSYHDWP